MLSGTLFKYCWKYIIGNKVLRSKVKFTVACYSKLSYYSILSLGTILLQIELPYIGYFSRGSYFRWFRDLPEKAKNWHSEK